MVWHRQQHSADTLYSYERHLDHKSSTGSLAQLGPTIPHAVLCCAMPIPVALSMLYAQVELQ